jgi:hypothetical protein
MLLQLAGRARALHGQLHVLQDRFALEDGA